MAAALSDFWYWWSGVLGQLVRELAPARLFRPADFTVGLSGSEASIFLARMPAQVVGGGVFKVEELAARISALRAEQHLTARSGVIRLAPGLFILRPISTLSLPASRLEAAAALDLDVATPFKAEQVHILAVSGAAQRASYVIVKRSILDPVIADFERNGIGIRDIEFETADQTLSLASSARRLLLRSRDVWPHRLSMAAGFALLLAVCGTAAHLWVRNSTATEIVSAQVDALASDAKIVRQALDKRAARLAELTALRKNIEDTKPVTGIWEELAQLLPDSAYLTDLEVKGGQVTISGYARQAAALIVVLEQSPLFSNASFTAPVVNSPGQDGERFQISLAAGG